MKYFLIFVAWWMSSFVVEAKLPAYIQRCHRNEPKLSECVLRVIENLQPVLAKGDFLREIRAPLIEPFFIEHLAYGNEKSLFINVHNIVVKGGSGFKIEKLRTNMNELKFDAIARFPHLEMSGKYKFTLNLLNSPVRSEGDFYTAVDNSKARISLKGRIVNRNGVEYLQFQPIQLKILPGDIKALKLSNLFGGNRLLGETVTALLLNNKEFLLNDTTPHLEKALSKIFTDLANKAVSEDSFNELFPLN